MKEIVVIFFLIIHAYSFFIKENGNEQTIDFSLENYGRQILIPLLMNYH